MRIRVLFVCHGNICRSPMAEFMFAHMINQRGLSDKISVASCATSREEIGNDTHYGTKQKLKSMNVPMYPRAAVQITKGDYDKYDYIIAMDTQNIRNLKKIIRDDPQGKIFTLLEFAHISKDIADPWYTGNFDKTYEDISLGLDAFMEFLYKKHGL